MYIIFHINGSTNKYTEDMRESTHLKEGVKSVWARSKTKREGKKGTHRKKCTEDLFRKSILRNGVYNVDFIPFSGLIKQVSSSSVLLVSCVQ